MKNIIILIILFSTVLPAQDLVTEALNTGDVNLISKLDKLSDEELKKELSNYTTVKILESRLLQLESRVNKLELMINPTPAPLIKSYKELLLSNIQKMEFKDFTKAYNYDDSKNGGYSMKEIAKIFEFEIEAKNENDFIEQLYKMIQDEN